MMSDSGNLVSSPTYIDFRVCSSTPQYVGEYETHHESVFVDSFDINLLQGISTNSLQMVRTLIWKDTITLTVAISFSMTPRYRWIR
jgi:hypothetical protein